MKIKYFLNLCLLVVLSGVQIYAQTDQTWLSAEFDQICQEKFPTDGPGGAVLVAKGDQIIYHKAFGMDDVANKKPLQTGMVFRIGSVTKQFTAVAILQLVEKGKLSLQDEITKFIPDYPTQGKKITVEQLLTHTSGIKSYTGMVEWTPEVWKKDFTPAGLIDFFKNQPMDFEPGTKHLYNNSGYVLLGYIIEKVSGKSYAEYLEKNIFQRTGLKNTFYETKKRPIPNWATGYQPGGSAGYEAAMPLSMTQPYAAGSLASTVEDLYRWTRALHAGKVVSLELLKKAHTPTILPNGENTYYGYGWILGNLLGSPTIEHDGGINGFLSSLIYLPKEDICVAILTNCDCNPPGETAAELAALAAGHALILEEIDLPEKALAAYTGVYENGQKEKRIVSVENGALVSNRLGGRKAKLSPVGKDKFRMNGTLVELTFMWDKSNNEITSVSLNSRTSTNDVWTKTDSAIPEAPKEIQLSEAQLEPLIGEYQLAPTFSIVVTRDGAQLYGQATGQPRFEMFAKSELRFFLKVVEAEIEFFPGADGSIDKMILFQAGREMTGARLK